MIVSMSGEKYEEIVEIQDSKSDTLLQKIKFHLVTTFILLFIILTFYFISSKSSSHINLERLVCETTKQPYNIQKEVAAVPSFCKALCTDPCSFHKVNGYNLCCDWILSTDNSKKCLQTIDNFGVCSCGELPSTSSSPVIEPEVLLEDNYIQQKDIQEDSFHMKPFRLYKMKQFDYFNFKKTNANYTYAPCKQSCEKPCAWSESGNERLCCESSIHGCEIINAEGKCYCKSF